MQQAENSCSGWIGEAFSKLEQLWRKQMLWVNTSFLFHLKAASKLQEKKKKYFISLKKAGYLLI